MLKVLFACGGTAGHINPALAIAEIIKENRPDAEFCFAGTPFGIEAKLIPEAGYRFEPIKVRGFQRKITPKNIKRNFEALWYLATSGKRAQQIIKDFSPDLVIGTGGYASGPVVRKAAIMGIKTAIHEANAFAGVTTKLLSKYVDKVMLTVSDTKNLEAEAISKSIVTGLPVRKTFSKISREEARKKLGIPDGMTVVLSTGGSLGARVLNNNISRLLEWYQENDIKVFHIHSYGTYKGYADFVDVLEAKGVKIRNNPYRIVKEYIDMPLAMSACDLVISRCGASTVTEIEAVGRGAILIPSPNVAENHQYYNGMVLENAGAGIVIEEKDLSDDRLVKEVSKLLSDKDKLCEFSKNSAGLYIEDTPQRVYRVLEPLIENVK